MEEERFWFRERGVERYVGDSFHEFEEYNAGGG